jgi:hypothetical protein
MQGSAFTQGPPSPRALKIGSVLLQGGAFVPKSIWVEKETYCPDWHLITNLDGDELDRQIRDAHWNFMFVEGALHGSSWGSWSGTAVRCALIRVLRKTKVARLNGLEITGIHKRRFLGFPYVTVAGHSRHVQKALVLPKIAERARLAAEAALTPVSEMSGTSPLPAPAVAR